MARTFPTPVYTTIAQLNGTTKRKLSVTSPGTTDSLATKGPSVTVAAAQAYYLSPETVATAGTLNAVGTAAGIGWGLVPSDAATLVPLSTDGFTLSAGTFTVQIVAARDSGTTSADQTCTFTAILFRANATATTFAQELGRQASGSVTMTTTKTAFSIAITTVAATFSPGDIIWLELYAATTATTATGSIASYYTNSTTSVGFTAATVTYSTMYNKALADTVVVSDSVTRKSVVARALSETVPISDSVTRTAAFPRNLAESLTAVSDTIVRAYTANRSLSESVPVSDSVKRQTVVARNLAETVAVADTLGTRSVYSRALTDVLGTKFYPVLIFEE